MTAYSWSGIHSSDTLKLDSTKILGAPVHVWNQIFQDLAGYDEAKLYIMQLQVQVKKAAVLQAKSDTAVIVAQEKAFVAKQEATSFRAMYDVKDKQNEQSQKDKRRYKRERDVAIFLDVLLTVVILIVAL